MNKILTNNVWEQLVEELGDSPKTAAIAYVSSSDYIQFSENDVLICDASDAAIKTRQTSAEALNNFYKNGAKLYSYPNLHAKIIWTQKKVVIGSNNLSNSSAKILREVSLITDNKEINSQTHAFLIQLLDEAQFINEKRLKSISKIKLDKKKFWGNIQKGKTRKNIQIGNQNWILALRYLSERLTEREEHFCDEVKLELEEELKEKILPDNFGWIRYTGSKKFRREGKPGDSIIRFIKNTKTNRILVFPPVTILKRQDKKEWSRFYFIEDGKKGLSWTKFTKSIKNAGLSKPIKYTSKLMCKADFNKIDEAAFVETK